MSRTNQITSPANARAEEVLERLLRPAPWGSSWTERTSGVANDTAAAVRTRRTSRVDLDLVAGRVTHRIVQRVLAEVAHPTPDALPGLVARFEESALDRESGLGSARSRVAARAGSAAVAYLRRIAPTTCHFVGSEVPAGDGSVDLVWRLPDGGVFFDEIKTTKLGSRWHAADPAVEQATGYARAGFDLHGNSFAGVRLLPILLPTSAVLATVDGTTATGVRITPLAATPLSVDSLRLMTTGVPS